jgi:AraC-like DNA-binding protein
MPSEEHRQAAAGFRPLHLLTNPRASQPQAEMARELFGRQILRLDVDPIPEMDFHIDLKLLALPGLKVLGGRSSGMSTPRTPSLLTDGNDDIFITLSLGGQMIADQRGQELRLSAGMIHLASNAERMNYIHLNSHSRGFLAPRKAIAALAPDLDDRIAAPLPPNPHAFGLLANYASTLGGFSGLFNQALAGLSVEHIYDLIALAIGPSQEGRVMAAGRGLKQARLAQIKAHIERRLAGDLSIGAVALAYGLTERYVQRLFEQDGSTFSTYVLRQRLGMAKRLLSEPATIGQSISLIAYDCGFHDVSHFNHMFRRTFAATPSEVRAAALEGGS